MQSGGGKSTTIGLIERFYDPDFGRIEFEGVDIRDLNTSWYRDQIGIVQQEPTLFSGTIAKNIAYGYPGATKEQIQAASVAANAHEFIMSFPRGYDTDVGEGGKALSGWQKVSGLMSHFLKCGTRPLLSFSLPFTLIF